MSKPPEFRRLMQEDFVDVPWIDRLITPINVLNEQMVSLFDKRLEIGSNVVGQKYSTTFTTSATYVASGTFTPIKLAWDQITSPNIMLVGYAQDVNDPNAIIKNAVTCSWTYPRTGIISINYISGLADSKTYSITLVAF